LLDDAGHVLRFDVSREVFATFREAMIKVRRDAGGSLVNGSAFRALRGLGFARRALSQVAAELRRSAEAPLLRTTVALSCAFMHGARGSRARSSISTFRPELIAYLYQSVTPSSTIDSNVHVSANGGEDWGQARACAAIHVAIEASMRSNGILARSAGTGRGLSLGPPLAARLRRATGLSSSRIFAQSVNLRAPQRRPRGRGQR
jgi:hypothetical protein